MAFAVLIVLFVGFETAMFFAEGATASWRDIVLDNWILSVFIGLFFFSFEYAAKGGHPIVTFRASMACGLVMVWLMALERIYFGEWTVLFEAPTVFWLTVIFSGLWIAGECTRNWMRNTLCKEAQV